MVKQALNRIFWRFGGNGNNNPFPVNQADLDALQELIDYFEQAQKQQFEANQLFAKLYIANMMRIMDVEGSTVFDTTAKRRIGAVLKKPISQLIEELTESLNDSDKYALISSFEGALKHPATLSEVQRIKRAQDIKESLKSDKNVDTLISGVWKYEDVEPNIVSEINHIINLYK